MPDYLYRIEHPDQERLLTFCEQAATNQTNLSIHNAVKSKQLQRSALSRLIKRSETPSCSLIQNETLQLAEQQRMNSKYDLVDENGRLGILLSAKASIQLITNPIVGKIIPKFGSTLPMFFGFIVMTTSTLMFAYADTYALLIIARAIQGFGSSFSSISSACMITDRFPDDRERGIAFSRATSGVALGVAVGPVFGGVLYNYFGKTLPFLILAGVALIDGLLRLSIITTDFNYNTKSSSLRNVVRDPLILTAIGASMVTLLGVSVLDATLPIHIILTMTTSSPLYQGMVFLPSSIALFISQHVVGGLAFRIGRWLCGIIGLCVTAVCFVTIPWTPNLPGLFVIQFFFGAAIGMVMASMVPTLATLVDLRHTSLDYGNAFALFETGLSLSFMLGPPVAGYMVRVVGFHWVLTFVGLISLLYAPLLCFLRSPKPNSEQMALIDNGPK